MCIGGFFLNYELYSYGYIVPWILVFLLCFSLFLWLHHQTSKVSYTSHCKDSYKKDEQNITGFWEKLNVRIRSNREIAVFMKVLFLGISIFFATLVIFQLAALLWIFDNIQKGNTNEEGDLINTGIYQLSQIIVPTIGVILTGIFSYLIFYSTERSVGIANSIYKIEEDRDKEKKEERLKMELQIYKEYLITRINTLHNLENDIKKWRLKLDEVYQLKQKEEDIVNCVFKEMDIKREVQDEMQDTFQSLFTAGKDIYNIYYKSHMNVSISIFQEKEIKDIIRLITKLESQVGDKRKVAVDEYAKNYQPIKALNEEQLKYLKNNKHFI